MQDPEICDIWPSLPFAFNFLSGLNISWIINFILFVGQKYLLKFCDAEWEKNAGSMG